MILILHGRCSVLGCATFTTAFADHKVYCDEVAPAGTPHYMAPELMEAWGRLLKGAEHDQLWYDPAAADWWSVGAVLYEVATGNMLLPIDPPQLDSAKIAQHWGISATQASMHVSRCDSGVSCACQQQDGVQN